MNKEKWSDKNLKSKEEAYKQLNENENKYRTLVESIDEGFCIIKVLFDENENAVDYRFLEVNPAFEEQTGINDAEGKKISEIAPNHEEHWFEIYGKVALTRESVRFERPAKELDRHFNVYAFPFGDPESKKVAVLFTDITLRKENDYTNAWLRAIIDNSEDAIISKDLNGVITSWNTSAERMFGYTEEEALGRNITMIIPDGRLDEETEILNKIKRGQRFEHFETIRKHKDGSKVNMSLSISPIRDSEGKIVGASKIARDITKQKQTEKELRESKERLRTALEINTVGVLFWGADFTITEANNAFLNMSGFSYEEAIGKTWQELTPEEFHEDSKKTVSELQENGHTEPYEKQYFRKDGSRWWGLFAPRQINDQETVEFVLDITDRKLREQRDQYLLKLNDALRSIYDTSEIQAKAIHLLKEQLNADRVLYIESDSEEDQYVIKNEATGDVPSIVGKINLFDFGSSMMDKLSRGTTYIQKNIPNDPNLTEEEKENYGKINVKSKIAVPLLKKEKVVVILAVHRVEPYDWPEHEIALIKETAERTWAYIERLRAEQKLVSLKNSLEDRVKKRTEALRSYQGQLRSLASRLNKAEQKEQHRLAAELHDNLGQLLSLGKMKIQNLEKNNLPDDTATEIADLSELINDALTYTRELMTDLKPPPALDKEDFVKILDWLAKKMKKHGLEVTVENDDFPKPLNEEVRTTLHQSVKELLFNVVKHSGVNEARVKVSRHNSMIQIAVEDTGSGFNMEWEKPIPTEEGGFGLFNIRERMNYLGGKFEIHSEVGDGTKATLYAPLTDKETSTAVIKEDKALPPNEQSNTPPALRQKIKILVVDDHKLVRRGLRNLIEGQDDMSIIAEAADGKKAVELAHKTNPDVILMDVNMPVMDGIEATREITSSLPKVKVIGLSLHNQLEVANNMRSAGAIAYLTKDEAFEALCATIRSEAVSLKS